MTEESQILGEDERNWTFTQRYMPRD